MMSLAFLFAALYYSAFNFAIDLRGEPDTRPGTWGDAGYREWTVTFRPPAPDMVTRIRRVYGDLVAWPRGRVEEGRYAGVLFGLLIPGIDNKRVDLGSDASFLYIQDAVSRSPRRASFSESVDVILPENKLTVRVAVWLNDTGREIHIEPTFTLGYEFGKYGVRVPQEVRGCTSERDAP